MTTPAPEATLAAFIAARYDEAEAWAKEAGGYLDSGTPDELVVDLSRFTWRGNPIATAGIVYIAMNRPQDRLADIKLKRAILSYHDEPHDCGDPDSWADPYVGCRVARWLGTEFGEHPAYKATWKP